jgi:hypothetical protein
MLRHSRLPTSTNAYQQVIPEEVKMVNLVHGPSKAKQRGWKDD